jgi:TolB-like protein
MSGFFDELKRRNVVRVAIAYVVVSWVIMQIIDVVVEPLRLPDWTSTLVLVLLLIGLPVALLFSWAFELTPEGMKKTEEVDADASITHSTGRNLDRMIIGALAIAVGFLVFDRFAPPSGEIPLQESAGQSIAVLPFVNLSEDKSNEYFSDGLSEELLNVLTKFPGLKVAGRTSSFAFKGKNQDLRLIGEALSVSTILEGSVRKQQNRVRITAQLIRVADGFHIWSDTFDRELEDIFAVQEEIATSIGQALAVEMNIAPGQSLITARTSNMAAYDLFLEGRTLVAKRETFERSIRLLEESTLQDPQFAPAWAALAQAHALSLYYLRTPRVLALATAENAARRALEIDLNLASAHSVMGDILRDRGNWSAAEESYKKALALNPDEIEANSQYAQLLMRTFQFERAAPYAEKAAQLDPLAWIHRSVQGLLWYGLGRKEEGLRGAEMGLSLAGGETSGFLIGTLTGMALDGGDAKRAIELFDRARAAGNRIGYPAEFFESLEDRPAAIEALRAQAQINPQQWAQHIYWALYLEDIALAEEILVYAGAEFMSVLTFFDGAWLSFEFQAPLRKTDTFKRLIRQSGVLAYWRTSGWPETCRPLEGDDFECD